MSVQVLASEVIRRTSKYQPSIWGDQFIAYTPDDEITHNQQKQQIEDLKVEVRKELMATASQPSQQLKYIDAVQRLGVGYHFEKDIEDSLQKIYDTYDHGCSNNNNYNEDLYFVSLWFRLWRQQGYNVSSDIFKKFLNEKGSFRESMTGDVSGLLCLYEAAHLRDHGEDVLDEALSFTIIHLQSFAATTQIPNNPLTVQVNRALKRPHRKGLPRVDAKHYISAYQEDVCHSKPLLMLAKLDFNLLQNLHKEELRDICIWWKELDLTTKLTFTRDRIVESYFWALGVYFEPQYSLARRMLAKVSAMLAITDDIYDNYGTQEELELYTEAIERWDIKCLETIPGNMLKLCYQTLLNIFHEEIEEGIAKGSRTTYRVHYAKEAMKKLVQGYFAESKWYKDNYIPTMEEYMDIGLLTTANTLLTILSFAGMGDIATKEAFDWVLTDPKMMTSSAAISRLMDDMVSHKFEQERGHIASSVECYMKQHGVSEKHVYDVFQKQVTNAWKDMNHQCITPLDHVPMSLLTRILNFARVIDFIYKDEDGFSHNGKTLKDGIVSLLVDPVPI